MKKALAMIMAAVMVMGISTVAFAADINVNVENKKVVWTDAKPFIKDGRTLVPLCPIAQAMGLEVNWYSSLHQAYFGNGDEIVKFTLDSKNYEYQNLKGVKETKAMDVAAISVDGRIYVPARYLAEGFGYNVGWNGNTSTVTISKGKVETVVPEKKPAATNVKTDPLPPTDISKQADWYLKLTPAYKMTNAQLVKEVENMSAYVDSHTKTDSTQIRLYDLQEELKTRTDALNNYAMYAQAFGEARAAEDVGNDQGLQRAKASDIGPLMDRVPRKAYYGY